MPLERYFIDADLKDGETVLLQNQEFHHFLHVMRTQLDEEVEIINGQGLLATAHVSKIGKKSAELKIRSLVEEKCLPYKVILAQAIPRIHRLDFIVEKGTELGMTDLWLFPGALSERKNLSDHQLERLRHLSIAAAKQCGRLWLPTIQVLPPLAAWETILCNAYFGDLSEAAPPFATLLKKESTEKNVLFVTGPESGFDPKEEEFLKMLGAQGVKLHPHILRTDTASLVALTLISISSLTKQIEI